MSITPIRTLVSALVLAVGVCPALAQEAPTELEAAKPEELSLTVYSTADPAGFNPAQFVQQQRQGWNPTFAWSIPGFGVVKEVRSLELAAGANHLRMTDVAAFIDPTTVSLADLGNTTTQVLEQAFEFDLVSPAKLLERYVDREVHLLDHRGADRAADVWVTGTLLSASGGQAVLQTPNGIRFVSATDQNLRLPPLETELVTRPTLLWKLAAEQAGARRVRTTYQTAGLTWRADYHLTLDASGNSAQLGAWVTLMNLSGASYPNTKLELIAGDVQRVQPQAPGWGGAVRGRKAGFDSGAAFEERSLYEYHLYSLPRRTDVKSNSTQQIALFPTVDGVTTKRIYVYDGVPEARHWRYQRPQADQNFGVQSSDDVDVYIEFRNRKDNQLGIPLPAGKVRVYAADEADGDVEFVGEDVIDHTPRNEDVRIRTGNAFDVVGERRQIDFQSERGRNTIRESFEIVIKNRKEEAVRVLVKESLYRWSGWTITASNTPHEKLDSRTVHFPVDVPADGEKKVTYTVTYTW